ncbi:MAG TPA: hypothetical protein DF383_08010, partial [Deltaproteobacteria bacterium]|nr:hypothetical protein [Deltaproteobacteria bacterium]
AQQFTFMILIIFEFLLKHEGSPSQTFIKTWVSLPSYRLSRQDNAYFFKKIPNFLDKSIKDLISIDDF